MERLRRQNMIGANLVLACQRSDCNAVEIIDMAGVRPDMLIMISKDEWPGGWGWDIEGPNEFLHCPDHREA